MDALINIVIAIYVAFIMYLVYRLRRFSRLPREQRRSMTQTQRILYLYGLHRPPRSDIQGTVDRAMSSLRRSWEETEDIFRQFETILERRKKEMQEAEKALTELQKEIQQGEERLHSLSQLTPEAAREVSEAIGRSGRASLRQQIVISFIFFVLGVGATIGVSILIGR